MRAVHMLSDVRVLEFTHAIMGPSCGLVLADLGAEVIKVEPAPGGDYTRQLKGYGSGFFTFFNRNKRSLAVNLKTDEGAAILKDLLEQVDVIIENFAPGTLSRLGFGYEQVATINPRIVYCSLKGFMDGPYQDRTALDEPVQMMSGLAYMTGPPGNPLRAGASITDILAGTYGALGILAALREREKTGKGMLVQNGLFETAAYLMGQHLAYAATETGPIQPFPGRVRSWAIYRIFETKDDARIFLGVTSNQHWQSFCEVFDRPDLYDNPALASNNLRYDAASWLLPELEAMFQSMTETEVRERCQAGNFPYAPVNSPEDLWNDPHLAAGTWLSSDFPERDLAALLPRQPLLFDHIGHDLYLQPPQIGEHTVEILSSLHYDEQAIEELIQKQVIVAHIPDDAPGKND